MPFSVRCEGCSKDLSVPDDLSGQHVVCPTCGKQFLAEPPLMPPTIPGAPASPGLEATIDYTAPPAKSLPQAVTRAPIQPSAPPPRGSAVHGAPPPKSSTVAPPPLSQPVPPVGAPPLTPPPRHAPPPRQGATGATGFEIESHEALERAMQMSRSNPLAWILPLALVLIALLAFGGYGLVKMTQVNPPLVSVEEFLAPADEALRMLGPRQRGAGYSFNLPESFVPASNPSTAGMPGGTTSAGWKAKDDSEEAGSEFRVWVIPRGLNLNDELAGLDSVGSRLEYHAYLTDKSTYRRIGREMLCVRALVEGSTNQGLRKGSIYLIADGKRTLMVIGMAAGTEYQNIRFMLDHAVRTIEREF